MGIGKLVSANSKGQVVIPQEFRAIFGITANTVLNIVPKYNGLFIEPVSDIIPQVNSDDVYMEVLKATQGSWGKISLEDKAREKLELEASARRKQEW